MTRLKDLSSLPENVEPIYRTARTDRELADQYIGKLFQWWCVFSIFAAFLFTDYGFTYRGRSLVSMLPLWGGFVQAALIISWKWQRRMKHSDISGSALRYFTLNVSVLSFLSFFATHRLVNCHLDFSQPAIHKVKIIKKVERSGTGNIYFLTTDWRNANRTIEFRVKGWIFNAYNVGDEITVIVKQGLLGDEWVQEVK